MKTSQSLFCCLLLVLNSLCDTVAQENDRIEAPRFAVKWSPFHLIYFYPSAQFAIDHKVARNFTLSYDLGWVLDYHQNDSEDYSNKRGFRGLAELRYYIPSPRKIPLYLAGEYYYHRIQFDRSSVMGYGCTSGKCDYFEYITYTVQTHQQGVGLKFGMLLFPGWNKNKSFFFDLQAGFAYRFINYEDIGKPQLPDSKFFDNNNHRLFVPEEDNHSALRPVIGVRLGYRIL